MNIQTPLASESRHRKLFPMQPLGRFYLIEVDHREGSFIAELDNLTRGKNLSPTDGLTELKQRDHAIAVYECIPAEGYMRDVSEDMARLWLAEILTGPFWRDFDPADATTWPSFIGHHLTNDEAQREMEAVRGVMA